MTDNTKLIAWLNAVISDARSAIVEISAQTPVEVVKKLSIPWLSQNDPRSTTDDYSNSDCGPACVAMILRARAQNVTIDDVSKATDLPQGYKYTTASNLIHAAAAFGLTLVHQFGAAADSIGPLTLDKIKNEIDAGRPVIVLVHYGSLPLRFDQVFKGGHFVLAVGYAVDSGDILYHDPYWLDSAGQYVRISGASFAKAQADCSIDGNRSFQGLTVTP